MWRVEVPKMPGVRSWRQEPRARPKTAARSLSLGELQQGDFRNQLLALRLRAVQERDDEHDRRAGRRDQHRNGEAERLTDGEVGQQRPGEAAPDRALMEAKARPRR